MNANKTARQGGGGRQLDVINIHAATVVHGSQSKLNPNTGQKEDLVPMMVLCEWEGCTCGARDIDDDQMTWQPEAHFHNDFLRKTLKVLIDFKEWYSTSNKVEDMHLTWPLLKETRSEVLYKPSFGWVGKHPSVKARLN